MNKNFSIGVFGIILNEKYEVLLCHRRDMDLWNLPGGAVENLESPWDAVKREVLEETGLNIKIDDISGIYAKRLKNEVVIVFRCSSVEGTIRETVESDKIEFFNLQNLPENLINNHRERISDSLLPGSIMKEQK